MHDWLDKHIIAQTNHYTLSPKTKDSLFKGAAEYGELLEQGLVMEPEEEARFDAQADMWVNRIF